MTAPPDVILVPDPNNPNVPALPGISVIEIDDTADGLVVAEHVPQPVEADVVLLDVGAPDGPGGSGVDPALLASLVDGIESLDGRVDVLEAAPPDDTAALEARVDALEALPTPATEQALQTGLAGKASRLSVREVDGDTTAAVAEVILADPVSGPLVVTPPGDAATGDAVAVFNVDSTGSAASVFWAGSTHADADAEIVGRWNGATFVHVGGGLWIVHSVNASYTAVSLGEGDGPGGLSREQADALYDPLGAAAAVTKTDVGLGNVADTAPADLPISTATQDALDALSALTAATHTLSGQAQITLDTRTALRQAISMTGDVILQPPGYPFDQAAMRVEFHNPATAARTVSVASGVVNASMVTLPLSVPAGRVAIATLAYSQRAGRWTLWSLVAEPAPGPVP